MQLKQFLMKKIYPSATSFLIALLLQFSGLLNAQTICPAPTSLIATNTSATGTVLYLGTTNATAGVYNVRYHSANSTAWITLSNIKIPYQLGNLSCNTGYEWQVQQVCAGPTGTTLTTLSDWSVGATFTTLSCPIVCPAPTGLLTTYISTTSAVLSWDPIRGASAYLIRYKQTGKTTTYTTLTSTLNRIRIGGLNTSTSYIWQVQAICSSTSTIGSLTTWSATAQFSTPYVLLFPNPTRSVTKINYSLAANSKVRVSLLNYFGKEVLHLNEGIQNEGNHSTEIDCSSLPPGIYFVQLTLGSNTTISKLVISR